MARNLLVCLQEEFFWGGEEGLGEAVLSVVQFIMFGYSWDLVRLECGTSQSEETEN